MREYIGTNMKTHSRSSVANTPPLHADSPEPQPRRSTKGPGSRSESRDESRLLRVASASAPTSAGRSKHPRQMSAGIASARAGSDNNMAAQIMAFTALPTPPSSPSRTKSDISKENKRMADMESVKKISSLRTKLGLDGWRCGCLTQKKEPCIRAVGVQKQEQANSLIKPLISLTWSDPELELELDKLATLVHCHQHDGEVSRETRIEGWIAAFPGADGGAGPVLSVDKKIRKILGRVSVQCIGTTSDDQRCLRRIGGRKVQNCTKTINEIVKPEIYSDDIHLGKILRVLETNMYCHLHAEGRSLMRAAKWKLSIVEIRGMAPKVSQSIEEPASTELEVRKQSTENQAKKKTPADHDSNSALQDQGLLTPARSRSLSARLELDPVAFWPETFDISAFDIIGKAGRALDASSSHKLIQTEILRPLDKQDQASGYLYLFEVEGNPGLVKLGYTGRSLEIRHQEWEFNCNRAVKILYPLPSDSPVKVLNAKRIEALCHAELLDCNIIVDCKGCLKQHIEWFQCSPDKAIAVIRKWSKLMTTGTCLRPPLRSGLTEINEAERKKAQDIEKFMKELSL